MSKKWFILLLLLVYLIAGCIAYKVGYNYGSSIGNEMRDTVIQNRFDRGYFRKVDLENEGYLD